MFYTVKEEKPVQCIYIVNVRIKELHKMLLCYQGMDCFSLTYQTTSIQFHLSINFTTAAGAEADAQIDMFATYLLRTEITRAALCDNRIYSSQRHNNRN